MYVSAFPTQHVAQLSLDSAAGADVSGQVPSTPLSENPPEATTAAESFNCRSCCSVVEEEEEARCVSDGRVYRRGEQEGK